MKLKIQPSFVRDTKKSPKHIIAQFDAVFSSITAAKKPDDILNLKKLSGYKNAYRIRMTIIELVSYLRTIQLYY